MAAKPYPTTLLKLLLCQRICMKGMLSLARVYSRWCVYPWSLPVVVCLVPGPFQGVGIPGGGMVYQGGAYTWKVHPLEGTLPVQASSGHHRSRRYASIGGSRGGVRDTRPPLGVQILSISCSFRENLACSRPPWRVHAPPSGKSWIRHWHPTVMLF